MGLPRWHGAWTVMWPPTQTTPPTAASAAGGDGGSCPAAAETQCREHQTTGGEVLLHWRVDSSPLCKDACQEPKKVAMITDTGITRSAKLVNTNHCKILSSVVRTSMDGRIGMTCNCIDKRQQIALCLWREEEVSTRPKELIAVSEGGLIAVDEAFQWRG